MSDIEIFWTCIAIGVVFIVTSIYMFNKRKDKDDELWAICAGGSGVVLVVALVIGSISGTETYTHFKIDRIVRKNSTTIAYLPDGQWITSENLGIYASKDELLCIEQKEITNMYGYVNYSKSLKKCKGTGKENERY